jgi:hypothetical protein
MIDFGDGLRDQLRVGDEEDRASAVVVDKERGLGILFEFLHIVVPEVSMLFNIFFVVAEPFGVEAKIAGASLLQVILNPEIRLDVPGVHEMDDEGDSRH